MLCEKSKENNLKRARSLIKQAATLHNAKLIVLPEIFTGVYGLDHFGDYAEELYVGGGMEDMNNNDNDDDLTFSTTGSKLMSDLARQYNVYIVGGVVERDGNSHYNTIAVYGPGNGNGDDVGCFVDGSNLVTKYRKIHLSQVKCGPDATSESSFFTRGDSLASFQISVCNAEKNDSNNNINDNNNNNNTTACFTIGLNCCFDLRFQKLQSLYTGTDLDCNVLLYPSAWLKSTGDLGHW